jgi:hypothetical protein
MKNRCSNAVGAALCGRPLTKGFPNSGAHRGAPLRNSKGISVLFLVIAMLLMVVIGYVFSYLIPTKQKSVLFPIQSNQAFFIAQSGAEFAVRYAKNQGWTTTTLLNNLNGITRNLGSGRFTLTYNFATYGDKLISVGEVPIGTERRRIVVSNFTSFLAFFTYRKSITVQSGQVSNGPRTNFPMLVSRIDPDLRTTANGGHVASYDAGTNDPRDIIFRALDDTTCGGSGTAPCTLDHEIERYVASTGELVAWVRLPSINDGTVIYTYYGNSCMPSSTQNASGVWNSNYRGVWHLNQNPTATAPQIKDSTANAYHGTAVGTFISGDQQAAMINGGLNFNGTNDEIQISAAALGATSVTVSAWIRVKSFSETTFSPNSATDLGAVVFSTRNVDGDVSPTLVVSPVSGGAGTQNGLVFNNDSANVAKGAKGTTLAISLNTWYYAVGTFSYSGTPTFAGSWDVYLNGTRNNATTNNFNLAGTATGNFTGATWRLGNNAQWPGFSNVILDEVRVSNTVRSADWIKTEYNNQKDPSSFYSVGLEEN